MLMLVTTELRKSEIQVSLKVIQGGSELYVQNVKAGRGDISKQISYKNKGAEMQR